MKLFTLAAALALFSCGADTESGSGDGDAVNDGASSVTQRASLEAAVPPNGEVVRGDFMLGAIVDSVDLVEVVFLIDGIQVGQVEEHPYQMAMSTCDLSEGNHAYIVMIEDAAGRQDFVEQFFESTCTR